MLRLTARQRLVLLSLLLMLSSAAVPSRSGWHAPDPRHLATASSSQTGGYAQGRISRMLLSSTGLEWMSGLLVVRMLSLGDGGDDIAYLLRRADNAPIMELLIKNEALLGRTAPGTEVIVHGQMTESGEFFVVEIFPTAEASSSMTYQASAAGVAGLVATDAPASSPSSRSGSKRSPSSGSGSLPMGTASLLPPGQWTQMRVVTEVSVLVMIATMCDQPPAARQEDVERVIFSGPGSQARTLQGYFSECSHGQAFLNRSNSKVVGSIPIPCNYTSARSNFSTDSCTYSDADGWHQYAQQYAQNVLGINVSAYQHRVLVMPRYFTMSYANCPWIGQGTLGPDTVSITGQYRSSKVWLSGEYWDTVMAYMHEIGHTNYLHHALQGGCAYCDGTCIMGSCCEVRCFNPPHNWQLGWSSPTAVLQSSNLPAATWVNITLPAQNMATANMLMIQPDWSQTYRFGRAYMWFIGYRIDSGKYDSGLSVDYTFQTNIYWWDGMYQTMPVMTNWMAALYNGEEFRNATDMIVVRQLSGSSDAATVSVCRISQFSERSCGDGLDNDCDGLVDAEDPDCVPGAATQPPLLPPPPLPPLDSVNPDYVLNPPPPPPHPIRPPHPPSPPSPLVPVAPSPPSSPPPSPAPPPSPPPPSPSPPSPAPPPAPTPPQPSPPQPSTPPPPSPPSTAELKRKPPPPKRKPPSPSPPKRKPPSPPKHKPPSPPKLRPPPPPLPKWKRRPPPHSPSPPHPSPPLSAAQRSLRESSGQGQSLQLRFRVDWRLDAAATADGILAAQGAGALLAAEESVDPRAAWELDMGSQHREQPAPGGEDGGPGSGEVASALPEADGEGLPVQGAAEATRKGSKVEVLRQRLEELRREQRLARAAAAATAAARPKGQQHVKWWERPAARSGDGQAAVEDEEEFKSGL